MTGADRPLRTPLAIYHGVPLGWWSHDVVEQHVQLHPAHELRTELLVKLRAEHGGDAATWLVQKLGTRVQMPPNFTLNLPRPGFGPAAELPHFAA